MPPLADWEPFQLSELPVSESQEKHNRTCTPCGRAWTASAYAVHEATHAAVAMGLGIEPEFVAIDAEQEIALTREEASLYPMLREGDMVPAVATRLGDTALRKYPNRVLIAMAAPSCVKTGHKIVDEYAAVEACIAVERAKVLDGDKLGILDRAKEEVERPWVQDKILDLARQLAKTGWVDLR